MTSLPVQMMDEPGEQVVAQVGELLDLASWHGAQVCNSHADHVVPRKMHARTAEVLRAFARAAPVAPVPEPSVAAARAISIKNIEDMLIYSRVVDACAIEDSEDYDDGVMRSRVESFHRRLLATLATQAAPVDTKPAERQPLTDAAIEAVIEPILERSDTTLFDLFRAIERAHGIQAKPAESGT